MRVVLRQSRVSGLRVAILREGFLSRFLGRALQAFLLAALLGLMGPLCAAQTATPITLDTSETLFAVLTAMNACGYDVDLPASDPQRIAIRAEVDRNLRTSEEAQAALRTMCEFYMAHLNRDAQHDLSQYVSLALYLQGPPQFMPRAKEDVMPPYAVPIAGFGALLERFYDRANLHGIWERHRANYAALIERYHEPLAKMVFDTDIYLKLQSGGYLGRTFTVLLDFMANPNEANARYYGSASYFVEFLSSDAYTVH